MKYTVTGYITNKKEIRKSFSSLANANCFIDSLLERNNMQVNDSFVENNKTVYLCDYYTRFLVEETI